MADRTQAFQTLFSVVFGVTYAYKVTVALSAPYNWRLSINIIQNFSQYLPYLGGEIVMIGFPMIVAMMFFLYYPDAKHARGKIVFAFEFFW